METLKILKPNNIYLNSFRPLCINKIGQKAVTKFGHPSFIDASCRREPDLENKYPSITSICRQGVFAPRLRERDIVIYISVKGKYYEDTQANNKLIAILQVDKVFKTHEIAYEWYKKESSKIPSNCMIEGNKPYTFENTASNFTKIDEINQFLNLDQEDQIRQGRSIVYSWDKKYKEKTDKWQMFVKTKKLYVEYDKPISLMKGALEHVFNGKIPNTRCAPSINFNQFERLLKFVGLNLQIE